MEWTAFLYEQTENIQILHCSRKASTHRNESCAQHSGFSIFCCLYQPSWLQYHTTFYLFSVDCLFNGGVCREFNAKPLWFFNFSLWPVGHFENTLRWACALRAVSGRVRQEPGKTNVRRTGERVRSVSPLFLWLFLVCYTSRQLVIFILLFSSLFIKNRSAMRTCGGLIISNLILLFCEFI